MGTEKKTDLFISRLLDDAKISYEPEKSNIKEIQDALKTASKKGTNSQGFPEFIGKSNEFIIVIEDKAKTEKQALYCDKNSAKLDLRTKAITYYAENGAVHYGKHIVKNTNFKKVFAFGCSGDESHHIIRPIFIDEHDYTILDEVENFENFNKKNIGKYYKEIVLGELSDEKIEIEQVLEKSKELNELLTSRGSLTDTEKPLVVSAILLALKENDKIDETLKGDEIKNDGTTISDAVCCNLQRIKVEEKVEAIMHQFNFIKDRPNLNQIDENLGKTPLKYFTEYIKEKIFPAISTTHEDILGFFYGEFIKYSGGDGQSLGIVLTPKHITELFCDLLDITKNDIIFDPCAGTGSFLISAMNRMLGMVETEEEKSDIKQNNLHGIELKENMFSIATTNMILRGDGKTNIICADFLKQDAEELKKRKYTVGMMNPPYSLRKNKDTAHLSEIHFVKHLLDSLDDNARCGVIVPLSAMVGSNTEDKVIKNEIFKRHTLEGVITLNGDTTFYGVGTNPCIAIFTAHKQHPSEKRCKFINFKDDGYVLSKQIGIIKTERAVERKEHLLNCWKNDFDATPSFMVKSKVNPTDEWLHSYYYFNMEIPTEYIFKQTLNEYILYIFTLMIKDKSYLSLSNIQNSNIEVHNISLDNTEWKCYKVTDLFEVTGTKTTPLKQLQTKDETSEFYPYITTKSDFMGVDGFYKFYTEEGNVIVIDSATDGHIHYQATNFSASDHVEKLIPKFNMNKYSGFFIVASLRYATKNKFNYGYKLSQSRIKRQTLMLPINKNGDLNIDFMTKYITFLFNENINEITNFMKHLQF